VLFNSLGGGDHDCLGEEAADQHQLVGVVEAREVSYFAVGTGDEFGDSRAGRRREGDGPVGKLEDERVAGDEAAAEAGT
jgi:hypothetical protein